MGYDFLDGFADRTFAQASKKVWTGGLTSSNGFVTGRVAGSKAYDWSAFGSLEVDNGGSNIPGASGFTSRVGFGAAFYLLGNTTGSHRLFETRGLGSTQIEVGLRTGEDGRLFVHPANINAPADAYTDIALALHTQHWTFIEFDVTYHEADGVFTFEHKIDYKVYIEGQLILDKSGISAGFWSTFTKFLNPSIISFGDVGSGMYIADFYFRTAGAFGCAARIFSLRPTSDGLKTEWGAAPQYDKVDELLLDTSDYIIHSSPSATPQRETFGFEDLPASVPGTRAVKAAQFSAYCEGSQDDLVKVYHRVNLVDLDDTLLFEPFATGKYNRIFTTTQPDDALASTLTAGEVNSIDAGVVAK